MAKAESKSTKQAKRSDGKKVAAANQAEIPFQVKDLLFTVSQEMFLMQGCQASIVGAGCGQPTAPRVELEWTDTAAVRQQKLKDLRKDLLQALLELESVS